MNGLARLSGRFRALRSERELGSGAERDERSLARHMRSLAVQLRVNGRARLSCPASLAAHTQALARAAGELLRESANAAATLQRLHQDARIMEACAAQGAPGRRRAACPPWGACRACWCSCAKSWPWAIRPSAANACSWPCAPSTMCRRSPGPRYGPCPPPCGGRSPSFCQGACAILERARERRAAERFVEARGGMGRAGDSPAFFERALQLAVERELPRSARPARGSDGPPGRERRKDDPPGA